MQRTFSVGRFFAQPTFFTCLLVALNIAIFGALWIHFGQEKQTPAGLFPLGGVYGEDLARSEYWRLIAYGFLHANLLHLLGNMLCLLLWGGHLERRVGPAYFLFIYGIAVIAGGVASTWAHQGQPLLTVGASGGVSGVLGALFCLWILDRIDLTAPFFIANIGLNIMVSLGARGIDWSSHLGGFTAGLLVCAMLEQGERLGPRLFRCLFPEPIKLALLALAALGAALLCALSALDGDAAAPLLDWALLALLGLAALAKVIDVALSRRYGLAAVAALLTVANGVLAFGLVYMSGAAICAGNGAFPEIDTSCVDLGSVSVTVGAVVFAIGLSAAVPSMRNSLHDNGFLVPAMRGARSRQMGL